MATKNVQLSYKSEEGDRQDSWSAAFLRCLFSCLDDSDVRYCVLHSWEDLPDQLSSDLDIAVHPDDAPKLLFVLIAIHNRGYQPVQMINYAVDGYCVRFLWHNPPHLRCVSVDAILHYQRGMMFSASAEFLVSGRRRHGLFWIPSPQGEFAYLLAKKSWKGTASVRQQSRLTALVNELGRPEAERISRQLFGENFSASVVDACATGSLGSVFTQTHTNCWKTGIARQPLKMLIRASREGVRLIRRWIRPTGLFVVVMGPDGVGKSTLIEQLVEALEPAFGGHKRFHWRPMLLWRRKNTRDTTTPHSLPPHGLWSSMARLWAHVLDYSLGYWVVIRPLLTRSHLVIFDRYYDDVLIDPTRYRYGGPLLLARLVRPLVPQPDVTLILDASEDVVLSRKAELTLQELTQQRRLYRDYQIRVRTAYIIDTASCRSDTRIDACNVVADTLTRRLIQRYQRWLPDKGRDCWTYNRQG